jgi:glycosyltransferase involved in cell wall biosynthesis
MEIYQKSIFSLVYNITIKLFDFQPPMSPINIGFLSAQNYLDKTTFSGTLYYMYQALSARNITLINLGNPSRYSPWQTPGKYLKKAVGYLTKHQVDRARQTENFIRLARRQLDRHQCDLIFAPVASRELVLLETNLPIIFLSDATAKLLKETYNLYASEAAFLLASQSDREAIARANKLVYSSEWVANSAICDYDAEPQKIAVIPFGANLDNVPDASEIFHKCLATRCRLLFVGKDWERKGGTIAFQTLLSLLEMGVDAELVVVGSVPPSEFQHERLKVIPFLNKNIPQQQKQYDRLLLESHFFVFPTRADCSPIVLAEANAYGIPAIATDVGGIPTIINNGCNGYMLPLSASSKEYAEAIAASFSNRELYTQLVRLSRAEYETRLNWDKWAERFHQVAIDTLNSVE